MTTETQINLRYFQQPDKLLANAFVTVTAEQEDFLSLNMDKPRPQLYREFKKKFNSDLNKLQFNFALERVKEDVAKNVIKPIRQVVHKCPMPDVQKTKNVYWVPVQGVWIVKFKRNGKTKSLGTFIDHAKAKEVADEYRQKIA